MQRSEVGNYCQRPRERSPDYRCSSYFFGQRRQINAKRYFITSASRADAFTDEQPAPSEPLYHQLCPARPATLLLLLTVALSKEGPRTTSVPSRWHVAAENGMRESQTLSE